MKKVSQAVLAATLMLATNMALAAGASGGMSKVNSEAESFKIALFAFAGIAAMIYLLWIGIQAMSEKKAWSDFGWGVVHVAAVGGTLALGNWAWTMFA